MITASKDMPAGIVGLTVRGTVLAQDVDQALKLVAAKSRLAVEVEPEFDGYMAELVRGLGTACASGSLSACALMVPAGMVAEASEHGPRDGLRIFSSNARAEALSWLGRA